MTPPAPTVTTGVSGPRPTPVAVVDASPLPAWAPLVKNIQRRLLRGDAPEDIIAPLRASRVADRMGEYPSSVAWLATVGARNGDGTSAGSLHLRVKIELPASAVIAELGPYRANRYVHAREEPDDLWFDPVASPHLQLQLVAVEAEPGVEPPAGNISLFEFHLERPVDGGVDAGVGAGVPPANAR